MTVHSISRSVLKKSNTNNHKTEKHHTSWCTSPFHSPSQILSCTQNKKMPSEDSKTFELPSRQNHTIGHKGDWHFEKKKRNGLNTSNPHDTSTPWQFKVCSTYCSTDSRPKPKPKGSKAMSSSRHDICRRHPSSLPKTLVLEEVTRGNLIVKQR